MPEVTDGTVTNLDEITNENGGEFYFFSTNPAFINVQETPEDPNLIFSETDTRYYISTESKPIWYDVPTENVFTLYSVFLTPNVHNSDFANAPLLNTTDTNVIISHDVVDVPYNAFSDLLNLQGGSVESVVIPNSVKSINSLVDMESETISGAFALCTTLQDIIIPSSVEYVGGEAFLACTGLESVEYENGYYLVSESGEHLVLIDTNLTASNVTIHEDCISIQGGAFSDYILILMGLITPPSSEEEILDYVNTNIQNITIPKNVKNIGYGAFAYCTELETITFEANSNLTEIGGAAFGICSSLRTINLEDTKLEGIGAQAFFNTALESVYLPSSVTSIGMGSFYNCINLNSITFEEGTNLTEIGRMAFAGCASLTSIHLPDKVASVGEEAFEECSNIKEIHISSIETYLNNLAPTMFLLRLIGEAGISEPLTLYINDRLVTHLEIPNGVESIPSYAFYYCGLTSITIPSSVTSIGSYALPKINLEEINVDEGNTHYSSQGNCLIEIQSKTLIHGTNNTTIPTDGSVTSIGEEAFADLDRLTSITIPNSITSIGSYAFRYCSNLASVTFEEGASLVSIENYAFSDCSSLTSIIIPSSVTSIGDEAFRDCSSLTSIVIPSSVTSIGYYAFSGCHKLVEVINLSNLNITAGSSGNGYVGRYAIDIKTGGSETGIYYLGDNNEYVMYKDLKGNHYLVGYMGKDGDITLPNSSNNYSINQYAFYDNNTITSVAISSSVTSIGYYAFNGCTNLTSITIPISVTSIEESAFIGCYKLVEVINLSSLEITAGGLWYGHVGYYADCIYTSLDTPLKQQRVGDYVFYLHNDIMYLLAYAGNDTNLILPSIEDIVDVYGDEFTGTTYQIYEYAFYSNNYISTLVIPECVTHIGNSAFSHCSNLTNINFNQNPYLVLGDGVFALCEKVKYIVIPEGTVSIGSYLFGTNDGGSFNVKFYCEASEPNSNWDPYWNWNTSYHVSPHIQADTYYAGEWKYDESTGEPRPIIPIL